MKQQYSFATKTEILNTCLLVTRPVGRGLTHPNKSRFYMFLHVILRMINSLFVNLNHVFNYDIKIKYVSFFTSGRYYFVWNLLCVILNIGPL